MNDKELRDKEFCKTINAYWAKRGVGANARIETGKITFPVRWARIETRRDEKGKPVYGWKRLETPRIVTITSPRIVSDLTGREPL